MKEKISFSNIKNNIVDKAILIMTFWNSFSIYIMFGSIIMGIIGFIMNFIIQMCMLASALGKDHILQMDIEHINKEDRHIIEKTNLNALIVQVAEAILLKILQF